MATRKTNSAKSSSPKKLTGSAKADEHAGAGDSIVRRINRIAFAIDRSGSMRPILANAIDAFNDNMDAIREQVASTGQDATVSLYVFDDEVECLFFNRGIGSISPLARDALQAGDMTALFDAAGEGINDLRDMKIGKHDDVAYLLNVITDGEENGSEKYPDGDGFPELAAKVQATDMWTLSFLVPKGKKHGLVNRFNIPEGNVMEWSQTAAGIKEYSAAQRKGIEGFFRARSQGKKSVRSFFTTDMSGVTSKDVKRALDDMSRKATVFDVTKKQHDTQIRDFIESKKKKYQKGCAFYELSKTERAIQDYKQILIMEDGKPQVYGGEDARQLLGLPDSTTSVVPGEHGKFRIFVQSTSVNRKVKEGTSVIYMPSAVS